MTEVGLAKKGWVMRYFCPKKGGHLKILVQNGGSSYFIIEGGNLRCDDYCYGGEH
jgi:hypothetical protein